MIIQIKYQNVKTSYLSNEIFYRVAYLRKTKNSAIPTGHIHVGFLEGDRHGIATRVNRTHMLDKIKQSIKNFLNSL